MGQSRFGAPLTALVLAGSGLVSCSRPAAPPAPPTRSGWVTVAGTIRIFYEVQGEGDTVIFIPGGFVDRRVWDDQTDDLSRSHTVIRYDLRGLGRSDPPTGPYRPAEDLLALYRALDIGRAALVGLSMGGHVALAFTLAHPEQVTALALVSSPALGLPVPPEDVDSLLAIFEAGAAGDTDSAIVHWLRHPMLASLMSRRELASRVEFLVRENARFFSIPFSPFEVEEPPPSERLGEITVPTLVVWGDRDLASIQQNSAATAERIPNARTLVLRGGHLINLERPSEFTRALRGLLGQGE